MTETLATPAITKEIVTGTMNIALTKVSLNIQTLSDMEASLTYNADNLASISQFIDKAKQAKRIIEKEHSAIKEPYLRTGQVIDESKRNMLEQIDGIMRVPNEKYISICREIENQKRIAEQEKQRKQAILSGIDSNMISFSGRIASCKTDTELLLIERLINLEKANRKKYAEFFDEAIAKYETLTALIKTQKESIREFEALEAKRLEAEKKGDDESLIAIQEQQVNLEAKIDEAKVTVQESAINQSSTSNSIAEATEILPEVKVKRASWSWEVSDISKTVKTMPSWTKIETVDEKIDEFMKASKSQWEGKEEIIVNGIRFYLKKTY